MASHQEEGSKRRKPEPGPWNEGSPMRPGKTAEDKRTGSWASKQERNARQAAYRGDKV